MMRRSHRRDSCRSVRRSTLLCFAGVLGLLGSVILQGQTTAGARAIPSAWSVSSNPSPGFDGALHSVVCLSSTQCVAVGSYSLTKFGVLDTLVESWNGSSWSVIPSPNPSGNNELNSVSCLSATDCVAVGVSVTENLPTRSTLIETWDGGTWSVTPSPDDGSSFLYSVTCLSSIDCVAVGTDVTDSGEAEGTLIETWNGSLWSITPSVSPGSFVNDLNQVTCTSSMNCVAVGDDSNGADPRQTLIESFDGTNWSVVPSPNEGTGGNIFDSVSCTSATTCMATGVAGEDMESPDQRTLAETWDGSHWTLTTTPDQGSSGNSLGPVVCTSTDCVTTGYFTKGSNKLETLVQVWNGTSWTVAKSVDHAGKQNIIGGLACTGPTSCVAVGYYRKGNFTDTLIESEGFSPT